MGWEKVACWSIKAAISLKRVKIEEKLLWRDYRESQKTFRALIYKAHHAVIFVIAQLSCYYNPGGLVTVTPGSRPETYPVATVQTDVIHSASAIGTWTEQKEFVIAWHISCCCCRFRYAPMEFAVHPNYKSGIAISQI